MFNFNLQNTTGSIEYPYYSYDEQSGQTNREVPSTDELYKTYAWSIHKYLLQDHPMLFISINILLYPFVC